MRKVIIRLFAIFLVLSFFSCDDSGDDDTQLLYISVTKMPTKTVYYNGEDFDPNGIVVEAHYFGSSTKDVTKSVKYYKSEEFKIGSNKITVSYTENGKTCTDSFFITIEEQKSSRASYPYDKSRVVTVSFQYYRRESTADAFQPYTYSEEPYDDINGTVVFKINSYGMNYKVGDVVDFYRYYPKDTISGVYICNIDDTKVKQTKYINDNTITLDVVKGGDNVMPYSFLFTDKADELGMTSYMQSSEISIVGVKTLLFEESVISTYKKDYNDNIDHITFKGTEYPAFETDENNILTKASILIQPNNYFVCVLTVETSVQDVKIDFPAELWGIDHFE